jgi:hypothetical protein
MIVDWTDQDALVRWDVVCQPGAHIDENTVRVRRSFLRFVTALASMDGRWESLSPWLRLGQLRVAGERSRLIAGAIEKDAQPS